MFRALVAAFGVVCAALAFAAESDAAVSPRSVSASAGRTRARLTYFRYPRDYGRPRPRLTIARGRVRFSAVIPPSPQDHFGASGRVVVDDAAVSGSHAAPLVVRDLDGDGEPEVSLMLFWGGMRCCYWSRVYRFDARADRYRATDHFWGNDQDKPTLRVLRNERFVAFLSRDGRFAALSPTYAYVDPVQIWSYRRGVFSDVTRRYPAVVRRDARALWLSYTRAPRGIVARWYLAAWVGDEYRLGRRTAAGTEARRALAAGRLDVPKSQHMRSPDAWVEALFAFLRRIGY